MMKNIPKIKNKISLKNSYILLTYNIECIKIELRKGKEQQKRK